MRKLFLLLSALALGSVVASAAPFEINGYVQASHGWVKNREGKRVSIQGMVFPYSITPIEAKKMGRNPLPPTFSGKLFERFKNTGSVTKMNSKTTAPDSQGGPEDTLVLYQADAGDGYGYIELNPSSLDDLVLASAAVNKPWEQLTFGFNFGSSSFHNFLIRWRIWNNHVDMPVGQNDFTNEIADFGVIWNQSVPMGAHKVTIQISAAGVTADDTTVWMAQQFRDPTNLQGEGPFDYTVDTVFNNLLPPTTGSSENQFWYDWDPAADGKYEDTEIDVLETGQSNHLWRITSTTSSTGSTTTFPLSANVLVGTPNQANTITQVWFPLDNQEFKIAPYYAGARNSPVAAVTFDGPLSTSSPTSLRTILTTRSTFVGVQQRTFLWNQVGNSWVQIDEKILGTTGTITDVTYGGSIPLTNFVMPGNMVRAKLEFRLTDFSGPRDISMNIDQVNWKYTVGGN